MYESHITLDPWKTEEERDTLIEYGQQFGWRMSNWTMTNYSTQETPREVFFTQTGLDRSSTEERMRFMLRCLHAEGYPVRRYKIEEILLDSKIVDEWNMLTQS